MPDMQCLDGSAGISSQERWVAPPSLPVREHAQVQHRGESSWPFLYSYRGATVIVNKAKSKTQYQAADEVGVALI
jgi:hypothetical protein